MTKKNHKIYILTRKKNNIKLLNDFIIYIHWDILIKKYNKKQLWALRTITKKKNSLYKIIKISKKYFMKIFDKLWINDIFLKWKIELKE